MRKAALLLPLLFLLAVAVNVWFNGPFESPATKASGDSAPDVGQESSHATRETPDPVRSAHDVAIGSARARSMPVDREVSVEYIIVDRATDDPIVGARVLDVTSGRDLGIANAEGRVILDSVAGQRPGPTRVAFVAEGFLIALFVTGGEDLNRMNREHAAGVPVEARLYRDTVSPAVDLRFLLADGSALSAVRYRCELTRRVDSVLPATGLDSGFLSAWRTHVLACSWPAFGSLPYHHGEVSDQLIRTCDGEQTLRVSHTGSYRCIATAGRQWIGLTEFEVKPGEQHIAVKVVLEQGHTLSGRVRSELGPALAGANIRVTGGALGVEETISGADGSFELGPFATGEVTLRCDHPEFDAVVLPRMSVPASPLLVRLKPAVLVSWTGVVRELGSGQPLASAQILAGGVQTRTDRDGRFRLRVARRTRQLIIEAPGYLRYVEMVTHSAARSTFDLVPAARSARVRAGLSAVVHGVVTDERGDPSSDVPVELRSLRLIDISTWDGRKIQAGGAVPHLVKAMTDTEGRYELETTLAGPSTVFCRSGSVNPARKSQTVTVVLGRTHTIDLTHTR